jgi:hypothetical protein
VPPVVAGVAYDPPVTEAEIALVLALLSPRIAAALAEEDT